MKKKKTISAALATALALTCMGSGGGTAFAVPLSDADLQTLASQIQQINDTSDSATASETPSAQADAVEGWTIDSNIAQGGEILEMANGWLHLKSTASNGNAAANPSSSNNWPAVAVWGTDYDFSKAGSFHATIKSPQELRQPLRLLPGLQRPGQRPVHRLRFGRLVLADLHRWR